ncbi:MAG TPA: 3,4-dihydroxy-2-butanone-4-phosphate synthase [Polyangiaceae bacterium]|jgi:3,4-dihydroxy 2-butanone 4-phosphate synthase/GTP cyclohydrolase II|nr:3,4-dihydroxy-2-butanone-4-phosphate synthase [Polyangiaceae bacterium]
MAKDVEEALIALARGDFVVVADDTSREDEGDLIIAAERVSREKMAFMLRHTSGVVCVALTEERADELELPLMVPRNSESQRTAFTVSVDFRDGTTTGISAKDRSAAIRALALPSYGASSFLRPGHVFPLRARPGGVLERRGHTEAAVDLARLAGFEPAGALCELVDRNGEMLRGHQLEVFAEQHHMPLLHIADLVEYRRSIRETRPEATTAKPHARLQSHAGF